MRRARPRVVLLGLAGLAVPAASCLDVADGRARRDLLIGQASEGGVEVQVAGGLAAVRALGPTEARLWAQAPAFELGLTLPEGVTTFELVVENVLSDATLTSLGAGPAPVLLPGMIPTEKRWAITRAPGAASPLALSLAPPDANRLEPWRFAAFADVQEKVNLVQDIYRRMNEDPSLRFVVMSGDLTSRGTAGQLERFQREMKSLSIPLYATLGNHELGTSDGLFQTYFGRANFSFEFRGVRFTLLDSGSATLAPAVYDWLDGWLEEGFARAHFVFTHIPPLDPIGTRGGAFASRLEANRLLARLGAGRVDLTIYGHVHSYYAFSNAGIPAYITGGGGAIPERLDGIGRHYLVVDVDPISQRTTVGMVRID